MCMYLFLDKSSYCSHFFTANKINHICVIAFKLEKEVFEYEQFKATDFVNELYTDLLTTLKSALHLCPCNCEVMLSSSFLHHRYGQCGSRSECFPVEHTELQQFSLGGWSRSGR